MSHDNICVDNFSCDKDDIIINGTSKNVSHFTPTTKIAQFVKPTCTSRAYQNATGHYGSQQ